MNDTDDLLAMGESVLRSISKEVDGAEVFISRSQAQSLGVEKNTIKSVKAGGETGIGIRIRKDGRTGFAYCSTPEEAPRSLEVALQGARISSQKPFDFPCDENYTTVPDLLDKRVLDLTPEEANEIAVSMIGVAKDVHRDIVVSGGGLSYGEEQIVIMNSQGLEVSEHLSGISASISTVFMGGSPSSGFEFDSSHLMLKDFSWIAAEAAELAVRGQGQKRIETGKLPVIFKPEAISNLLEFIVVPALYGIKAEKGESVYSGKLDSEVMDPGISIMDDPTMPDAVNAMRMDDEGVPSRSIELIKNGVLKQYLYSIETGSEFGKRPTGNGVRGGGQDYSSPISTSGRNIMIQGNTREEDSMIAEISEGLMVHDIMGAHTSNPASGDFSVTGSILFLIKDGEVSHPVSQAMLSGNLPEYLKEVSGIGNNYRRMSGGLSPVGFYVPSIMIDGIQVTGEQ